MIEGFEDWCGDVGSPSVTVTLIQGYSDPQISIEASRAFAADFPDTIKLIELADGGGLLNYTHTQKILDIALGI